MATIEQRITTLEKLIADRKPCKPWGYVVLGVKEDDPEEYERKQQQIVNLEAAGNKVIVYEIVAA